MGWEIWFNQFLLRWIPSCYWLNLGIYIRIGQGSCHQEAQNLLWEVSNQKSTWWVKNKLGTKFFGSSEAGMVTAAHSDLERCRGPHLCGLPLWKSSLFMFYFYGEGRSKLNISGSLFYLPLTNKFFLAIYSGNMADGITHSMSCAWSARRAWLPRL